MPLSAFFDICTYCGVRGGGVLLVLGIFVGIGLKISYDAVKRWRKK